MKITLLMLLAVPMSVFGQVKQVPKSTSPDGKLCAVIDTDRDPTIVIEWKGDSYPKIEITNKKSREVLATVMYFGALADDARPLREHVRLQWRPDSTAFAVTIDDRNYSATKVFALTENTKWVEVPFPSYETMTGSPKPAVKNLRPRGRGTVTGWDKQGNLSYRISLTTHKEKAPLNHNLLLKISASGMKPIRSSSSKNPQ